MLHNAPALFGAGRETRNPEPVLKWREFPRRCGVLLIASGRNLTLRDYGMLSNSAGSITGNTATGRSTSR